MCGLWTSMSGQVYIGLASHHMEMGVNYLFLVTVFHMMNLLELRLILCEVYYGLCCLDPQWSTIFSGVGRKLDIDL
jgi:hypothetical protein